jgi:TonB family protein
MKLRLTFALLVFPGLFVALPQSRKPLTNSDIISMVKQNMSDSVIVNAIQANETAFDISPEQCARLNQAGVSEDIIKAMIAAEARKGSAKKFIPGLDRLTHPEPIRRPNPPYTDEARAARVEGILVFSVNIRKDGTVDQIKVLKGLGYGLEESAINTISTSWLFKPGTLDGTPVDVQASIEVSFRLSGNPSVLFDTLGPKDLYSPDNGWELGFCNGDCWVQAIGFNPTFSGRVSKYQIAVSRGKGGSRLNA